MTAGACSGSASDAWLLPGSGYVRASRRAWLSLRVRRARSHVRTPGRRRGLGMRAGLPPARGFRPAPGTASEGCLLSWGRACPCGRRHGAHRGAVRPVRAGPRIPESGPRGFRKRGSECRLRLARRSRLGLADVPGRPSPGAFSGPPIVRVLVISASPGSHSDTGLAVTDPPGRHSGTLLADVVPPDRLPFGGNEG
jgi:hypothetical protein